MEEMILGFFEGITKIDFNFVWTLLLIALGIFWIVVLYWVWLDSGDRTSSTGARVGYVLLTLCLSIPGLIIYLLIRPPQTIEEIYWADLERRYLKYETSELGDCPRCGTQLFPGFKYCPNCRLLLKVKCPSCEVEMDKYYQYCPSCGYTMKKKSDAPVEEEAPSKEIMEEQIQASKEEAVETVKAKRTRYSGPGGVAEKLGDGIIKFFNSLFKKDKEEEEVEEEKEEEKNKEKEEKKEKVMSEISKKVKKSGKKKNKKRK